MKKHLCPVICGLLFLCLAQMVAAEHPNWTKQEFMANDGQFEQPYQFPWQAATGDANVDAAPAGALNISYESSFLWTGLGHSVVDGNYCFVASPYGLIVFDVTDPSGVDTVASLHLPLVDLDRQSNYLYLVGDNDLTVVDVTLPTSPYIVATFPIGVPVSSVAVQGDYAYVGTPFDGLAVVNVANPLAMYYVGGVGLARPALDMDLQDTILCIAEDEQGLRVLSIADPAAPVIIGYEDTPQFASGVDIDGDLVFVGDHYGGAVIIDISDPTNPSTLATVAEGYKCDNVLCSGSYLYFEKGNDGLGVVDISDPGLPGTPISFDTGGEVWGISKAGDMIYASREGLWAVDVADPTNPAAEGHWRHPYQVLHMYVRDRLAFVPAGNDGLYIYDITDPSIPQQLYFDDSYYYYDIAVQNNLAFVAASNDGLLIFDISNPTAPLLLSTFAYETENAYTYMVDVVGDYAYIAGAAPDFQIIDISDPTDPSYVGGYGESTYWGFELVAHGDLMLVAAADDGALVIDASDPTAPTLASTIPAGWAEDVAVQGDYVFVADGDNGLWSADISNPLAPAILDEYPKPTGCIGVDVEGDYAWIAYGIAGGFEALDITDPTNLTSVDAQSTPGFIGDVEIDHGLVCVADYYAGAVYMTDLYEPPPEPEITIFEADTVYAFWANAVEPINLTVLIGNLPDGHGADEIDGSSVILNGSITPLSYELTVHPDFDGPAMACSFAAADIVRYYEPVWGTTPVDYEIGGMYVGDGSFSFEGQVVMVGHVPGDVNADGQTDISDLVMLVHWMFQGGASVRDSIAADINRDGTIDISDLIALVGVMF